MSKVFFLGLFLFFTYFAYPVCYSKDLPPDPYTWDFGQIKEGEILKHEFILKNESNKVLTIKDVNTSCGCTTSEITKRTLLPQESTTIEVRFNTKGYSGQVKQYIYVNTDNLDNPLVRYIIKADVGRDGSQDNREVSLSRGQFCFELRTVPDRRARCYS